MIFAKIKYEGKYTTRHNEIVEIAKRHFNRIKFGYQADSWVWIYIGDRMVAIDSFSSEKHWVKSEWDGPHVDIVIDVLKKYYELEILDEPELEPHE